MSQSFYSRKTTLSILIGLMINGGYALAATDTAPLSLTGNDASTTSSEKKVNPTNEQDLVVTAKAEDTL